MKFFYAHKAPTVSYSPSILLLYICADHPVCQNKHILREPAKVVTFPLSKEHHAVSELVAKYDVEKMIAGLATQIGPP
jgi:hypothetical protein